MSGGQGRRDAPTLVERGIGRRDRPTLAERSHDTHRPAASNADPTPPPPLHDPTAERTRIRPVRQRHCWVTLPDSPGARCAGLVVAWQESATGWRARTIYVVDDDQAVVIEAWVPAEHLQPL